jgi:hypothetical protein
LWLGLGHGASGSHGSGLSALSRLRSAVQRAQRRGAEPDRPAQRQHRLRRGLKVSYNDLEIGLAPDAEIGSADSGDLESDLPELFLAVGEATKEANQSVAILIDQMQFLTEKEFIPL